MKMLMLTLSISSLLLLSCSNEGNKEKSGSETSENSVLATKEITVPKEWSEKFKNAPVKKFEKILTYAENKASVKISCESFVLDTANSLLKNVQIVLIKGAKNCQFYANIDEPLNMTDTGIKNLVTAEVWYDSPKVKRVSKQVTISSSGLIEEMK